MAGKTLDTTMWGNDNIWEIGNWIWTNTFWNKCSFVAYSCYMPLPWKKTRFLRIFGNREAIWYSCFSKKSEWLKQKSAATMQKCEVTFKSNMLMEKTIRFLQNLFGGRAMQCWWRIKKWHFRNCPWDQYLRSYVMIFIL